LPKAQSEPRNGFKVKLASTNFQTLLINSR
jgi:hypothetical protein